MRKAITMPEFHTAIQNKTTDSFSARELLELLNNSAEMATANGNETADLIKAIADNNKAENESICTDKCKVLIAMERDEMFRTYCVNPTYTGHKFSGKKNDKTDKYELTESAMRIKFAKLEKVYRDTTGKKYDTLCNSDFYGKLIMLFNGFMAESLCTDLTANKPVRSEKMLDALKNAKLDCFTSNKNNKETRLAQLQAIYNAILPETLTAKALSCDMAYIKTAYTKAKMGTVTTLNDNALIDEIIVTIGYALSFDESTGKRSRAYDLQSKSAFFKKAK